ncbi:HIT family protein [Cryptosporangium arvum]|uniref:HIT family protein n=1 Tax=Cryptosporangium arvum TaxID=80871 RepID=UPI000566064A|nr:HIT domain-containing protein [Cryptosporangium arvum]
MADSCVFCEIVAGTSPASVVHADEDVLAIMDIQPVNPGHLLVIPRRHVVGLADLPEDLGSAVWSTAHRLAGAVRRSGLRCEGINLFLADGEAAFQEVFHVHLHVVPRFTGDTFRLSADWRVRDRDLLDSDAAAVRESFPG